MSVQRRILAGAPVDGLDDFVCRGGGKGLHAARHRTGESTIALVERSGLRGRGGAGFPTGAKLRSISNAVGDGAVSHVVVNAAEGEPGTFKDRAILRHNPYEVVEGASIVAVALGICDVVIATKASFTHERDRLAAAIAQMAEADMTGGLTFTIVDGPGEYLFGEETALLEVIDGRPPFPRVVPPYRSGITDHNGGRPGPRWSVGPAVFVSNVETYANLPGILRHGADWFREIGTAESPGTIVCTVTGDTAHHGIGEFALGTTLREVIDRVGGGVVGGRGVGAVLSGVSNRPFGPGDLDTPLTYEATVAVGSGLGSASFIVVDDGRDLRDVAAQVSRFLAVESCGQCEPCKRDGLSIASALADHAHTATAVADLLANVARGARCALAGQQERVVGALLELADASRSRSADDHGSDPFVVAPLVDIVRGRARLDLSHLDKRADWTYAGEEPDSHAWPVERLLDHHVEVRRPHTTEAAQLTDPATSLVHVASRDAFEALSHIEDRLEHQLEALRTAPPDERMSVLYDLRSELERHRRVTEHLVYPLVRFLGDDSDDDAADEIAWYPQHHEQHATRLLRRLEPGSKNLAPVLVDELCADVHASIVELQRRVLPLLRSRLATDVDEQLLVEAGVRDLLGESA